MAEDFSPNENDKAMERLKKLGPGGGNKLNSRGQIIYSITRRTGHYAGANFFAKFNKNIFSTFEQKLLDHDIEFYFNYFQLRI